MMDVSDTGICRLEPQLRPFIRVQFNSEVCKSFALSKELNSINVRELMSAVLAVVHWGPRWAPTRRDRTHAHMWIDNASAVNTLQEANHHGKCGFAGMERAWSVDHLLWINLSHSWTQVANSLPFDNLWRTWKAYSLRDLLQIQQPRNTVRIGVNAANSHGSSAGPVARATRHGWNRGGHGNAFGTIKLKLASIRWYRWHHQDVHLFALPEFMLLMQGIKRLSPRVHKLQPITPV
ncbi:hypothetical protein PHMEG_00015343 [Phytophthora megakarya]|uniref:Uncharacterized protein n=1 Tax=Phytophthora megakarya TaxID=4795 RepID=A0A225W3M1_9STRA|nr:hypothetical protein PHMEG_00015343 [Phytophthora megakarya]